ncbi:MAG: VOC family protein [Anaerolineales bacterium]
MSKHAIVHIEIPSKNLKKNSQFYHDLFGWKISEVPDFNYAMFDPGEDARPGGGFPPVDGNLNKTDRLLIYVESNDIEADLKKAESLGGKTVMGKTEIPGQGWFGVFTDPEGNTLALYTGLTPS